MTAEEKLNQAAGTIEEGVKKYPSCKNFMIFIHIISVELCSREERNECPNKYPSFY